MPLFGPLFKLLCNPMVVVNKKVRKKEKNNVLRATDAAIAISIMI